MKRSLLIALLALGCSDPVTATDAGPDGGDASEDAGTDAEVVRDGGGADAGEPTDGGHADAGGSDGGVAAGDDGLVATCSAPCAEPTFCDPRGEVCVCGADRDVVGSSCLPYPTPTAGTTPLARSRGEACALWRRIRLVEHPPETDAWVPDEAGECPAGRMDATATRDAYRVLDGLRAMLGAGPVRAADGTEVGRSQDCALMVALQRRTADTYSSSVPCYAPTGVNEGWDHFYAAGARSPAEGILALFREGDWLHAGANGTPFFDPRTRSFAFGFFGGGLCGKRVSDAVNDVPDWFAHPGPGAVPLDALGTRWVVGIRAHRFVSDAAVVEVRQGEAALPVTDIVADDGSFLTVSFVPDGWVPTAGTRYSIRIGNLERMSVSVVEELRELQFDTELVACE